MTAEDWSVGVPVATGIVEQPFVRRLADPVIPCSDGEESTVESDTPPTPGAPAGAGVAPW